MCEFVVYLVEGPSGERREVGRNICMAKRRDGKLHLMESFGQVTSLEGVTIEEVNTFSQEMILARRQVKEEN